MSDEKTSDAPKIEGSSARSSGGGAPLIFISHDSRDADLAEAFSKLLSSVSAGVLKSFRSSDRRGTQGIEYGTEWFPELMGRLESASDVVCLLTRRSLDRPWILYEAGVAKGKLDTPVYGIALGIALSQASSGPFAQFQNSDDEEESLTKLVMQLLRRIPDSEPDPDAVSVQVRSFIDKAGEILKEVKLPPTADEADPPLDSSSVAKLFEEVKVMFQDLPSRVERQLVEDGGPHRRKRSRRVHPGMIERMTHAFSSHPGDPIGLLSLAGFLREYLPWISEILVECYRQVQAGDKSSLGTVRRAMRTLRDDGMTDAMGGSDPEEMIVFGAELPMIVERMLDRIEASDSLGVSPRDLAPRPRSRARKRRSLIDPEDYPPS